MLPSGHVLVKTLRTLPVWQNCGLMGLEDTQDKSEELFHASAAAYSLEGALARTCSGRRILVTGNTGFVGSWLAYLLAMHGAKVVGLSLPAAPEAKALRDGMDRAVQTVIGDVNNFATVLGLSLIHISPGRPGPGPGCWSGPAAVPHSREPPRPLLQ